MSLVLSRRVGQSVHVDVNGVSIKVNVAKVSRNGAVLTFEAPLSVKIWREELVPRVRQSKEAKRP